MRLSGIVFVGFLLLIVNGLSAQEEKQEINWMTWEEVELANNIEKRKIFVDLYTDWCTWCKKMEKKTLSKPHIISYLNDHYYAVKFNAQYKDDITINGKTYTYISNGKNSYNELAVEITKGKLSFPTIIFMDSNYDVIQPLRGFIDAKKLEKMMAYFYDDYHLSTPWREFSKTYQSKHQDKPQCLIPAGGR